MTKVYVTYDTSAQTWNVVEEDTRNCLTYGTTGDCDQWLFFKRKTHVEV